MQPSQAEAVCEIGSQSYQKTNEIPERPEIPELRSCKCAFCGKDFTTDNARMKFCSKLCSKKAWTAKRSRIRARSNGKRERACQMCGKPFTVDPEHKNQKFCSVACRKKCEYESRSRDRLRSDVVKIKTISESLPAELDLLREDKGKEYFDILFKLPQEYQFAEMEKWTEEDHEKALSYFGLQYALEGKYEEEREPVEFEEAKRSLMPELAEKEYLGE